MKVLDVGCGVGGPARQIANFTDARITGVNNNDFQLARARKYTEKAGLSATVDFKKGDFMKLSEQFGENSFDAGRSCGHGRVGWYDKGCRADGSRRYVPFLLVVYAIEATCHAPTFEGVYGEIFKVLKPGGVFGVYEWVMTDRYDASNPAHRKIAHEIELGDGIPEMRGYDNARQALKSVGFVIEHEEDLAEREDHVPWYYPLEGDIRKAQTMWDGERRHGS